MRPIPIRFALPVALGAMAVLVMRNKSRAPAPAHPPDSAPGRTARQHWFGDYLVTGRTVTIDAPRQTLFDMLRDPARLPGILSNLQDMQAIGPDTWRWHIKGPLGQQIEAHTRIVEERSGESLAWRSTDDSPLDTEGKITLRDAPGGRGTELTARIAYRPPGGDVGHWIATAFRRDPHSQGRHDLKRLKMLVETGEIATAAWYKET